MIVAKWMQMSYRNVLSAYRWIDAWVVQSNIAMYVRMNVCGNVTLSAVG